MRQAVPVPMGVTRGVQDAYFLINEGLLDLKAELQRDRRTKSDTELLHRFKVLEEAFTKFSHGLTEGYLWE